MDRNTLLELERKAQKLLVRMFELTNGYTDLMIEFGKVVEGWGWTDEECQHVENYAVGKDYIKLRSLGDTRIASFSMTKKGRDLAETLILRQISKTSEASTLFKHSATYPGSLSHFRAFMERFFIQKGAVWESSEGIELEVRTNSNFHTSTSATWGVCSSRIIYGKGLIGGCTGQAIIAAFELKPDQTAIDFLDGYSLPGTKADAPIGQAFQELTQELIRGWVTVEKPDKAGARTSPSVIDIPSGTPPIGNLLVPNDRPWIASGNPYTGGTKITDVETGQEWQPPEHVPFAGLSEPSLVTVNVNHTSGVLQPGTYQTDPRSADLIRLADTANDMVAGLTVGKAEIPPKKAVDTPAKTIDGVDATEDLPEWLKNHVPSNYWQIIQLWNKGYTYKDIGTRVSLTSGRVGNIISEQRNRLTIVYGKEKAEEYIKYHRSIKSRQKMT